MKLTSTSNDDFEMKKPSNGEVGASRRSRPTICPTPLRVTVNVIHEGQAKRLAARQPEPLNAEHVNAQQIPPMAATHNNRS
jgi:hypothetical protein